VLEVEVINTRIGIAPEMLGRIFDASIQEENATSEKGNG
jgi:signal transduction histidine kinase